MRALRNKETRELVDELKERYDLDISKKKRFERDENMLLIDGNPVFFYYKNHIVPTLKFLLENMVLPKVTVDMGAVKHIVNGADIMRPGITDIDTNIEKEEVIVVVDETHGKPLVVGIAKYDAAEMEKMDEGNVIENIHHVGDDVWNYT